MAEKVVDEGSKIWERGREAVMLRVAFTGRGGDWDLVSAELRGVQILVKERGKEDWAT